MFVNKMILAAWLVVSLVLGSFLVFIGTYLATHSEREGRSGLFLMLLNHRKFYLISAG